MKITKLNIFILLLFVCQVLASEEINKIENQNQQTDSLKKKSLRTLQDLPQQEIPPWDRRPRPVPKPKPELKGTEKVKTYLEKEKYEPMDSNKYKFVLDQEDILKADEISVYGFMRLYNPIAMDYSIKNLFRLEVEQNDGTTDELLKCDYDGANVFQWYQPYNQIQQQTQFYQRVWLFFYAGHNIKTGEQSVQVHYKEETHESFVNEFEREINKYSLNINFTNISKFKLSFSDDRYTGILDCILQNIRVCYGVGCFRNTKEGAQLLIGEYPEDIIDD